MPTARHSFPPHSPGANNAVRDSIRGGNSWIRKTNPVANTIYLVDKAMASRRDRLPVRGKNIYTIVKIWIIGRRRNNRVRSNEDTKKIPAYSAKLNSSRVGEDDVMNTSRNSSVSENARGGM